MTILHEDALTALFCQIDDFCKAQPSVPSPAKRKKVRSLCQSEIMTILLAYRHSSFCHFKAFYLGYVRSHWKQAFPRLVSYSRFIEFVPSVTALLSSFFSSLLAPITGLFFVDSTPLRVCHHRRIPQHKVFCRFARRGKNSMGWFYGFKLHLVINEQAQIVRAHLAAGNHHDVRIAPKILTGLLGQVVADAGYLSASLQKQLAQTGLELITPQRANSKATGHRSCSCQEAFLCQRSLIETVIGQLKATYLLEQSRCRSVAALFSTVLCALIAYCLRPNKPTQIGST